MPPQVKLIHDHHEVLTLAFTIEDQWGQDLLPSASIIIAPRDVPRPTRVRRSRDTERSRMRVHQPVIWRGRHAGFGGALLGQLWIRATSSASCFTTRSFVSEDELDAVLLREHDLVLHVELAAVGLRQLRRLLEILFHSAG